jgi:hypothetical protein
MAERQNRPPELVVISAVTDFTCSLCGRQDGGWLIMEDSGPVCMGCADVAHLVLLPSGDAALTRRAKAGSRLSAVVVRFSRARRRYERQGVLVEEHALERAEQECLADEELRERRRARDAERRAGEDVQLRERMAGRSPACSRAVRRSGLSRSRGTRRCGALAGWGALPQAGRLTRQRSSLRARPRSGTRKLATTSY